MSVYFIVGFLQDRLFQFLWENNPYGLVETLINNLLSELALGVLVVAASEIYFDRHITIHATFQRFINTYPRYLVNVFIYLIPLSLPSLANITRAVISHFSIVIIVSSYLLLSIVQYLRQKIVE